MFHTPDAPVLPNHMNRSVPLVQPPGQAEHRFCFF
jgi:hypothetical protein